MKASSGRKVVVKGRKKRTKKADAIPPPVLKKNSKAKLLEQHFSGPVPQNERRSKGADEEW